MIDLEAEKGSALIHVPTVYIEYLALEVPLIDDSRLYTSKSVECCRSACVSGVGLLRKVFRTEGPKSCHLHAIANGT